MRRIFGRPTGGCPSTSCVHLGIRLVGLITLRKSTVSSHKAGKSMASAKRLQGSSRPESAQGEFLRSGSVVVPPALLILDSDCAHLAQVTLNLPVTCFHPRSSCSSMSASHARWKTALEAALLLLAMAAHDAGNHGARLTLIAPAFCESEKRCHGPLISHK